MLLHGSLRLTDRSGKLWIDPLQFADYESLPAFAYDNGAVRLIFDDELLVGDAAVERFLHLLNHVVDLIEWMVASQITTAQYEAAYLTKTRQIRRLCP